MEDGIDTWFKREILVHEAALTRYLRRAWPRREEVGDLRQDIYIRVYEAADKTRPAAPRSFLFSTARHLMTDRIRRRRIVAIDTAGDFDFSNVIVDAISPERRLDAHQQLKRLAQAFNGLPPKCREVIWLRRIDGLPQKEVADRLGVSVRTVESHILKGMHLLADAFFGRAGGGQDGEPLNLQSELEHGKPHTD